jgi:ATP-dependent RNA helicase DeaD
VEVALAAVKLAHDAGGPPDEQEIPEVELRPDRGPSQSRGDDRGPRTPRPQLAGMTRLFIQAGREAGIRPQDLVGAITGETHLSGREVGAIEIAQRFSLVEVPEASADQVVAALVAT